MIMITTMIFTLLNLLRNTRVVDLWMRRVQRMRKVRNE
jgi:hypothetical protein